MKKVSLTTKKACLSFPVASSQGKHTPMVTGCFDTKSFHIQVVSIQFCSFEVYQLQQLQFIQLSNNYFSLCMYRQIVSHTWLKEWKTQNVFLVQMQTFFEVIKLFSKFHCLSSYQTGFVTPIYFINESIILKKWILLCGLHHYICNCCFIIYQ